MAADIQSQSTPGSAPLGSATPQYTVGGVRIARPFKVRRLGHFGVNVADPWPTRKSRGISTSACSAWASATSSISRRASHPGNCRRLAR